MSGNFDGTGKWLEPETEIKESNLPKEVSSSVAKNFAGFKLAEVAKTETPDKGLIYEMDLKKDKEEYEVQFSAKGDILSKTPLKKEKEEEEKNDVKSLFTPTFMIGQTLLTYPGYITINNNFSRLY